MNTPDPQLAQLIEEVTSPDSTVAAEAAQLLALAAAEGFRLLLVQAQMLAIEGELEAPLP